MQTNLETKIEEQTTDIVSQKKRLDDILIATNTGTWEWNIVTNAMTINDIWANLIGYEKKDLPQLTIKSWLKFVHPEDLNELENTIHQHYEKISQEISSEFRMRHKLGHWVWILMKGKTVYRQPNGKPVTISGTHQDISTRKKGQLFLESMAHLQRMCIRKDPQEDIYLTILQFLLRQAESQLSFIILCDAKTITPPSIAHVLYVTPKQQNRIYNHAEKPNPEIQKARPYFEKALRYKSTTINKTMQDLDLLITPMKGSEHVLGAFGSIKKNAATTKKDLLNLDMLASTIVSVIESSNNMSKIENMATKDALTGVFNRFYFTSHINQLWQKRTHLKQPIKFGILMMDLNGFKKINDYYGHEYGDFIIKSFAARAAGSIKSKDMLARIGGDEFVILIDHLQNYNEPGLIAERIINLASQPYEFNGKKLECSTSIGIACYPDSGESIDEILRNADLALYKAKNLHSHYCYFSETLQANFIHKQNLEAALKQALKDQEFYFAFQPQVNINTQQVSGAEALIRWKYAEENGISVGECVNTLELMGLSDQLNIYITEHITKLFSDMQDLAHDFKLSINISPFVHKLDKNIEALIKIVQPIVKNKKIHVDFEITETSFMESSTSLSSYSKLATQLKENGIGLSLDDFGIKYSSINRLFECDFSTLKIDRSFVVKLDNPDYPSAKAIVKAIIDIAKGMNIKLIAEGADTQAQVNILSELGCEVIQGYIYYRPLPFDALKKLI